MAGIGYLCKPVTPGPSHGPSQVAPESGPEYSILLTSSCLRSPSDGESIPLTQDTLSDRGSVDNGKTVNVCHRTLGTVAGQTAQPTRLYPWRNCET
ncbi:uncharacterized protein LDX57_007819 [Aspergillus melleus]|uniref:uncharacterized protein n=1 Tax=Aspergillus melleus TaxID=138277 RepID=UPI001E8EC630|nr:uncharacterized protein LDX57_007819 [Aspergillus melleus]KAH8430149.1 hypothetical protein LDX57_007819 [Aspergillus melleus]